MYVCVVVCMYLCVCVCVCVFTLIHAVCTCTLHNAPVSIHRHVYILLVQAHQCMFKLVFRSALCALMHTETEHMVTSDTLS